MGLDPSNRSLQALIKMSPLAMCITDPRLPDNPMIACNQAFTELTGYSQAEAIGRNCRFLSHEPSRPEVAELIARAIEQHRGVMFEAVNYRKDGTAFRNAVMVAPMFDAAGKLAYVLGSQAALTEVEDAAASVEARQAEARRLIALLSPRRREVLGQISHGKLTKQIAHELGLSEKTVKMHRRLLLQSLGVGTTADAVRLAVEAGL